MMSCARGIANLMSHERPPEKLEELSTMNCQRKRYVSSSLGARNAIGLLIVALLLSLGAPWFAASSASASSHHQSQDQQAASSTPQLIFAGVDSIPFRLYALHGDT